MRAVIKTRPGRGASLREVPERDLRQGEVRIAVGAVSVCGTDVGLFEDSSSAVSLGRILPVTLGHECAGTIVEVGAGVGGVGFGDRVAVETHIACFRCFQCRIGNAHNCDAMRLLGIQVDGAFTERLVVPASTCYPLPDSLGLESGALLEPAGSAMHAVQRARVSLDGARVLVTGAGPIGLVLVQIAFASGARDVVVVEPHDHRRRLAESYGATALHPEDDVVGRARRIAGGGDGHDVGFECSGAAPASPMLMDAVRREGTVVSVGLTHRPTEIDATRDLIRKGLTLVGSFGRHIWDSWDQLSVLVESGRVDLVGLVSHRMGLERFEEAFALVGGDSCKILLDPSSQRS